MAAERKRGPALAEMLRAILHDTSLPVDSRFSQFEITQLIRSGLGPMLRRLAPNGGLFQNDRLLSDEIAAADLAARAQTQATLRATANVLATLNGIDIVPTLIKGISVARYYPQPHLRQMGDVDVLIPEGALPRAEQAMLDEGYERRTEADKSADEWRDYHHGCPLYHPDKRIWLELHTKLLPPSSLVQAEPPLDLSGIDGMRREETWLDHRVHRFDPEFELLYVAVSWCRDFGNANLSGTQRPLIDACIMLNRADVGPDWDRIVRWSHDAQSGACLFVLLSLLNRYGGWNDADRVLGRLARAQPFVSPLSLRFIAHLVHAQCVALKRERVLSRANRASCLAELIGKRAAHRNMAAALGALSFPKSSSGRRAGVRHQLSRLRSLLRRL